jgi:Phage-related baseplate assembly protein
MIIDREYPDIEFIETDTETIESNMIALYEEMVRKSGRKKYKVYPASPERVFIAWCAAIIVQQRVLINETAKKNVPRYAKGEYLDSLAELFKDIERLPATPAVAKFRCYISAVQNQSIIVPKGTRITFDGEITFETTEELEIRAGETYGEVNGKCQTPGIVGNELAPGQVKEIVDVYDFYLKAENVTKTEGGAEQEGDAAYYQRMRESMESFSTAGPVNAYIYHAKSVNAAIVDVAATSPVPGVVDIRVLLQGGEQPTEAVLQEIQEKLNADNIRPLTDMVTVSAPEENLFEIDVTFYIQRNTQASSSIIDRDVRAAVEEFICWQTEKMGRDINPSYLTKLIMAAGVKRVEVRKPCFQIVEDTHVARIKRESIIVLNGGVENA